MLEKKSFKIGNDASLYFIEIDEPQNCPHCKRAIKPEELSQRFYQGINSTPSIVFTFLCKSCLQPFIAAYSLTHNKNLSTISDRYSTNSLLFVEPNRFQRQDFSDIITTASPEFVEVYNQALAAETAGLDKIAGVGYRKAFEFLIKDFLIAEHPADAEKIKDKLLGKCISEYVDNPNLKTAASRTAWLGNDHTHYIQKFSEMDISDLKRLVKLSMNWIEMILLTRETEAIVPHN